MHPQVLIMKQNELSNLRSERIALDAKIDALAVEVGEKSTGDKKPSPAQEFQAARDAAPSPFNSTKKN